MDYINIKCPVCNKEFVQGDDIVVCPECGTPHHRECYELNNHCANEDKHSQGFTFGEQVNNADSTTENPENQQFDFTNDFFGNQNNQNSQNNQQNNTDENGNIICPRCHTKNPQSSFYCGKCGFPIKYANSQQNAQNGQQPFGQQGQSFGFGTPINAFDPMAGINPEYKLDEDVTAGEAAKFTQKSTQYFSRVFFNLKEYNKGRFSFVGFIFSGGYLLYRKMYKLGAILASIMFVLMVTQIYITISPMYNEITQALSSISQDTGSYSDYLNSVYNALGGLSIESQISLILLFVTSALELALRIVVGCCANRWYYKHTVKQIKNIKQNEQVNSNDTIEKCGGVNTALALSLLGVYVVLEYLPMFF